MKKYYLKTALISLILLLLPLNLTRTFAADPADTYTVTIPSSYSISTKKSSSSIYAYNDGLITVSNVSLPAGEYLHVAFGDPAIADYKLTNSADSRYTIPFNIYSTFPEAADDGFPEVTNGSAGSTIPHGKNVINISSAATPSDTFAAHCYVGFDRSKIPAAGTYTGSVKFTVNIDTFPPAAN